MASRFDKTYDNAWVSSYVPLPLKEIQEGYKDQQKTYDEGMAALADKPIIVGGPTTKDHAKLLRDKVDKDISAMYDDAVKNNTVGQLPYKVKAYKGHLTEDPVWQAVTEDAEKGRVLANTILTTPGNESFVQDFYDPKTKEMHQQNINKIPSLSYYNTITPVDLHKDHTDFYAGIKPQLTKLGEESGRYADELKDADGNPVYDKNGKPMLAWYDIKTKHMVKGVTRDDVKKVADSWVQDPELWSTRGSILYRNSKKLKLTNGAEGYTPKEYSEDLTNGYVGYYSENADEVTRQQLKGQESPSRSRSAAVSFEADPDNRPKEIFQRMNDEGGTKVNAEESAAALGGYVDKREKNTVVLPITDRKIYLSTGEGKNKDEIEQNIVFDKAVNYKSKLQNIYSDLDKGNEVPVIYNNKKYYLLKSNTNVDENNPYLIIPEGSEKSEKSINNSEAKKIINNGNENATSLIYNAKLEGVDLNDPKLNLKINNTVNDDTNETVSKMLDNLTGEVKFIPSVTHGFISDDKGNMFAKGTVRMTIDQMKSAIPDETMWFNFWSKGGYKKLERDGLIKKIPSYTYQDENDKTIKVPDSYEMKATIPLEGQDVNNMTRNIIVNNAGGVQNEYTDKTVKAKIAEVNNTIFTNKTYKKYDAYNKAIQSSPDKSISILDKEINDLIAGKPTVDIKGETIYPYGLDHNSPSYNQDIADINALKVSTMESNKSKFEKAKVLLQIKHKLADANAYDLLYKNNESPPQYQGQKYGGSGMGKYQPQQDNSNPLGM